MKKCGRDHAGGNEKIKELVPGIKVYGGSIDNVKGCTNAVENGDKVHLGADINVLALHTPWYGSSTCQFRFCLTPFLFFPVQKWRVCN